MSADLPGNIALAIVAVQAVGALIWGPLWRKPDAAADTLAEWVALSIWPLLWPFSVVNEWIDDKGFFARWRIPVRADIHFGDDDYIWHRKWNRRGALVVFVSKWNGETWGWKRIVPGVRVGYWIGPRFRSRFLLIGRWDRKKPGLSIGRMVRQR